jgi:mannose-1-phosphate guanylyltransferase
MPKQLLPVIKGKSLLQLSYERLRGMLPAERIFICTSANYREQILKNIPDLPPDNLLGEPMGRDTANAVGFPAAVLQQRDKEAVFAITTADHVIEPVEVFQKSIQTGFDVTAKNPKALVTFGIVPTHGHTGLGYIHRGEALSPFKGAYKVQAFKEKPDRMTADRYVESGRYYWNSGMFVWRADTFMGELASHLPESHQGLTQIGQAWDTPRRNEVLSDIYPKLPKISVDYAVMEPAAAGKGSGQVVVVEMPVQWLDVGSWTTLAETLTHDDHDNAYSAERFAYLDSESNIVVCDDPAHVVSLIGVNDMIVVHTKDATMICPKSDAQRVKDMVGKLKEKYGSTYQ